MATTHTLWLIVGFTGQALFGMRFIVQWLHSERQKRSVIPTTFWYFSLLGGLTLLCYAIYQHDPVFIVGQAMGIFIYLRNLYFLRRARLNTATGGAKM
ncbi:MAG: lipid-A-disaccharide synthase N-terminal domain-containing protein [Pseudomonadota bacterium]|nr:lipid-A-disaccharide synthase N-terminal domain-containing protein [Pseudomonadota bacterium]